MSIIDTSFNSTLIVYVVQCVLFHACICASLASFSVFNFIFYTNLKGYVPREQIDKGSSRYFIGWLPKIVHC